MKCPNCSTEANDGAEECGSCHLVFAKWKAASERPRSAPPRSSSSGGSGKWIGLVLLAACAWAYSRYGGVPAEASQQSAGSVTAKITQSGGSGTFKPPSDHCGYHGRVMDIARQVPIPGTKIYFNAWVTTSDPSGRYKMIVRAKNGECKLFVSATHQDYQKNYWLQHFEELEAEEILAMRTQTVTPDKTTGTAGSLVELNFSLFPKEVPGWLYDEIAENASKTPIEDDQ